MFHDTVMSLLVVCLIVALAVVWKYTRRRGPDGRRSGWLGKLYDEKADPGTTNFVPRPDWYFYFLFYLLRIFKWPESVILGTVGIPTILLVLLLALPFIDVRRERRPLRRPVAMVGGGADDHLDGRRSPTRAPSRRSRSRPRTSSLVPKWAAGAGLRDNPKAWTGRRSSRRSAA